MHKLPLTVIGGYLGAGKTTLINRLLSEPHGQRVMVMVNDFGSVNIDAGLLKSASGDTLELTNGCVCCTMGNDLFLALGDALDRRPRPDHLVIEASGIADPKKIANAARAEPEMDYGGIALVVDAMNFAALAADAQIGAQIRGQVEVADLLLVAKCGGEVPAGLAMQLAALSRAPVVALDAVADVAPLILGGSCPIPAGGRGRGHGDYVTWSYEGEAEMDRGAGGKAGAGARAALSGQGGDPRPRRRGVRGSQGRAVDRDRPDRAARKNPPHRHRAERRAERGGDPRLVGRLRISCPW
ncbi:MAG: GTP-binding protein [Paracoccaceae bacterium]